jgi:hypothetical protein
MGKQPMEVTQPPWICQIVMMRMRSQGRWWWWRQDLQT